MPTLKHSIEKLNLEKSIVYRNAIEQRKKLKTFKANQFHNQTIFRWLFTLKCTATIVREEKRHHRQFLINHSISNTSPSTKLHHKSCTFHTNERRRGWCSDKATARRLFLFPLWKGSSNQTTQIGWSRTDKLRFYIWHLNGIDLAFRVKTFSPSACFESQSARFCINISIWPRGSSSNRHLKWHVTQIAVGNAIIIK